MLASNVLQDSVVEAVVCMADATRSCACVTVLTGNNNRVAHE